MPGWLILTCIRGLKGTIQGKNSSVVENKKLIINLLIILKLIF